MSKEFEKAALQYHSQPTPGKIGVAITKNAATARDLALAYSPGVAYPVLAIAEQAEAAYTYTNRGNLVGTITNGSAILGLGNLGPLASKPVMEGKSLLFKRFAGIDVFDIEVDCDNAAAFIETVCRIAPTFGGINLEDIKAPECFEIETALIEKCDIPVFHDDQHGTSIVTTAALLNALSLQNKAIDQVKIVCVGAGAAGIACLSLFESVGAKRQNFCLVDSQGVVHQDRSDLNVYKRQYAIDTEARTLAQACEGADVFLGLATADLLTPTMLLSMAERPIVFACSNPDPEIRPELALRTRKDIIIATGRSDYPNQVNNVLGFPFIFRGALDVRASRINEEMKLAAVYAIAQLAKEPIPAEVEQAYNQSFSFGPDYILPKPLDPRLLDHVSHAVAQAAVASGVARLPYPQHYPIAAEA